MPTLSKSTDKKYLIIIVIIFNRTRATRKQVSQGDNGVAADGGIAVFGDVIGLCIAVVADVLVEDV